MGLLEDVRTYVDVVGGQGDGDRNEARRSHMKWQSNIRAFSEILRLRKRWLFRELPASVAALD
jgi:hypothetical protein